jgi:hypothetical protein
MEAGILSETLISIQNIQREISQKTINFENIILPAIFNNCTKGFYAVDTLRCLCAGYSCNCDYYNHLPLSGIIYYLIL